MEEKKYAVLLTDSQEVKLMACDPAKEIFDIGRDAIGCEWIELVEPEPLARNHMLLMIDEEAKLKEKCFINCIASHLYGSEQHGDPIVGNAVIVKITGENLALLSANEAKQVAFAMAQIRDFSIDQVSEAFGLRPVHRSDAEKGKKVHRQTGGKERIER